MGDNERRSQFDKDRQKVLRELNDMGEIIAELTSSMWPPPYFAREPALTESAPSPREMSAAPFAPSPPAAQPVAPADASGSSGEPNRGLGRLLASHPYASAFLLGATISASCLAGAGAARYAMQRGARSAGTTGHTVLAEFTGDCAARLSRVEKLVGDANAAQAKVAEQVNLLPNLQARLSSIRGKLDDMENWKVSQLHSRLAGVETNMIGHWRDVAKDFDKVKVAQQELRGEMEAVKSLQGSLMDTAGRLDNFGKWSEVEVLNVLEGIKVSQEAALNGLRKTFDDEIAGFRKEMKRHLNEATAELVAANEKSVETAAAALDSKNKQDWQVITDTLSQVGKRLGGVESDGGSGAPSTSGTAVGAAASETADTSSSFDFGRRYM